MSTSSFFVLEVTKILIFCFSPFYIEDDFFGDVTRAPRYMQMPRLKSSSSQLPKWRFDAGQHGQRIHAALSDQFQHSFKSGFSLLIFNYRRRLGRSDFVLYIPMGINRVRLEIQVSFVFLYIDLVAYISFWI